jgi:hypothetical protein
MMNVWPTKRRTAGETKVRRREREAASHTNAEAAVNFEAMAAKQK